MASTLKFTSGAFTVDFLADAAYRVSRWEPAVATRRAGELGGRGPYNDVVEEMVISISGSATLTKLEQLQALLDRAQRWARGEPETVVIFHYQPTASSQVFQVPVLGAPGGDEPMIVLPPGFALGPATQMIDPITLRWLRPGLWLGDTVSATSSSVVNGAVQTLTGFTAVWAESPVVLKLDDVPDDEKLIDNSFILLTSASTSGVAEDRLNTFSLNGLAGSNGYTTVVDTTNKAANGNILRQTPTGVDVYAQTDSQALTGMDSTARRFGVWVNYRNNSATTSFRVRAAIMPYSVRHIYETAEYVVPAGVSDPLWVYLGAVTLPSQIKEMWLEVAADAASGSIDFDRAAVMALDNPAGDRAIAILNPGSGSVDFSGNTYDLVVDHRLLSHTSPAVYYDAPDDLFQSYQGDPMLFLRSLSGGAAVAWLGTGGTAANFWRVTQVGNSLVSVTVTLEQKKAYLIPV